MMCDFNGGFQPPEMVKRRPVITLSKKRHDLAPLCTVIPISSSPPNVVRDFHYQLPAEELPPNLRHQYPENWVKIDMIQTVSFNRLTMLWNNRIAGKRIYVTGAIAQVHQMRISKGLESRLALVKLDV